MESTKTLEVTSRKREAGKRNLRLVDLIRLPGESDEETMKRFHSEGKTTQVKRDEIPKKTTTQGYEIPKKRNHASLMTESKIDDSGVTLDEEAKKRGEEKAV